MQKMTFALTIAGFDGSAGAGILADIKAFRDFGVYGTAVCTALTVQNENSFASPGFLPWSSIEEQLQKICEVRKYQFVKIGLVQNAEILKKIVGWVRANNPGAFILWDPIMSASTGFRFFEDDDADRFFPVFADMDLITPNSFEYAYLGLGVASSRNEILVGTKTSILLKGGHEEGEFSTDTLWTDGQTLKFSSKRLLGVDKHGSGCTFSSAILANIARGKSLPEACKEGKAYIDKFLAGGEGRLGNV
ncbi:MAG: hydroxymethylpyrimidine/phosphomethylpyrimidine kinase [Fibrobacteraceae bacterium]|nr:hydroxymethylpyrimidine/phosphomethylpyrimidine kinase [Fibrobacteraceae bacterium]